MPLPKAQPRKMLHLRDIQLRGYEREDGLIEVEGHFTDVKTYGFGSRRGFEAGEPIHDMWLRVTIDREMVIQDCKAAMDATPHQFCSLAAPSVEKLKGLKIGKGFIKAAMQLLGGGESCTHLRELLQPVATVAFQTMMIYQQRAAPEGKKWFSTDLINTCYAYKEDGPLVLESRSRRPPNPPE